MGSLSPSAEGPWSCSHCGDGTLEPPGFWIIGRLVGGTCDKLGLPSKGDQTKPQKGKLKGLLKKLWAFQNICIMGAVMKGSGM